MKNIRKRIKEGEFFCLKTDKSSRFAVIDRESYLKMGREHTEKDREIDRTEIIEREKVINGHSVMWVKMNNTGERHDQVDRVISSKTTKSNNLSSLYFLIKDHKEKLAWRPVVTGCSGNTLGLSNSVSEFLEAVANSIIDAAEVISTEDLLPNIAELNRKRQPS